MHVPIMTIYGLVPAPDFAPIVAGGLAARRPAAANSSPFNHSYTTHPTFASDEGAQCCGSSLVVCQVIGGGFPEESTKSMMSQVGLLPVLRSGI
jgi:hypothetical protein